MAGPADEKELTNCSKLWCRYILHAALYSLLEGGKMMDMSGDMTARDTPVGDAAVEDSAVNDLANIEDQPKDSTADAATSKQSIKPKTPRKKAVKDIKWTQEMRMALHNMWSCYKLTARDKVRVMNMMFKDHLRDECDLPNAIDEEDAHKIQVQYNDRKRANRKQAWKGVAGGRTEEEKRLFEFVQIKMVLVTAALGLPAMQSEEDGSPVIVPDKTPAYLEAISCDTSYAEFVALQAQHESTDSDGRKPVSSLVSEPADGMQGPEVDVAEQDNFDHSQDEDDLNVEDDDQWDDDLLERVRRVADAEEKLLVNRSTDSPEAEVFQGGSEGETEEENEQIEPHSSPDMKALARSLRRRRFQKKHALREERRALERQLDRETNGD